MNIDKEFQGLIPVLSDEEYKGLEASIIAEGCRDALVVWGDTLVDGHNRYKICTEHNLPFATVQKEFADRHEVKLWIIDNQLSRRNINAYERTKLALQKEPLIAAMAKENQKLSAGRGEKGLLISENLNTQKEIAKIAKVGHDTVAKVKKIEAQATPEMKEQLKNGDISINQAYQQVKRDEKKQAVQQKIEEHAKVQTGTVDIFKPERKYNIIYADPAWQYWDGGNKNQSLHYSTMPIKDICELPVKNIADDNCVLFLWVTYPILREAFDVIEAWGFKYSTAAFVWVKKNKNQDTPFVGLGSWTRANSELCLLATKGNITRLDASVSQIVESPIEEHSRKPAIARCFLKSRNIDNLFQADWIVVKDNKYYVIEVKHKEKFRAPPFDGHGLDIRQVRARQKFYEDTGIRCLFLVFDFDRTIYYGWLDELEHGEHFDTKNGVRIYNIKNMKQCGKYYTEKEVRRHD